MWKVNILLALYNTLVNKEGTVGCMCYLYSQGSCPLVHVIQRMLDSQKYHHWNITLLSLGGWVMGKRGNQKDLPLFFGGSGEENLFSYGNMRSTWIKVFTVTVEFEAPARGSSQDIFQWLLKEFAFMILEIWDTKGVCKVFHLLKRAVRARCSV